LVVTYREVDGKIPSLITGFSGLIHLSSSELLGKKPDMAVTLPVQGSLGQAEIA
jgi:hypothetical protein